MAEGVARDLFGEIPPGAAQRAPGRGPQGGKHYTRPNGYAARPGSGPAGETCGSCTHACRHTTYSNKKRWLKCALVQKNWTHGRGSDILAGSPACSQWTEEKTLEPST